MELFSGSTFAGLRMMWAGFKWAVQTNKAPWSAADVHASLKPTGEADWFRCVLKVSNDKNFPLEIMQVKTVEPSLLSLCNVDLDVSGKRDAGSEARVLSPNWTFGAKTLEKRRTIFVNLKRVDAKKRSRGITLQLEARLQDNRRQEFPVLVKTNPVK